MVWVCYSSSSTCIAFVAALIKLLLFLLCYVICCFGGVKSPRCGFITPKGVVLTRGAVLFPQRGGCIPQTWWFYPILRVSIHHPGWFYPPMGGWFYAWDHALATPVSKLQ